MKRDIVQWFRQMAVLLQCGIPVTGALEICFRQTSDSKLQQATLVMLEELRVGQRFSQAMRAAGQPFDPLHYGAVEVGERQGDLSLVFANLAEHAEDSARVRHRIISALAYPVLVLSVSLFGLYLLIRFLSPVLKDVGQQLGEQTNIVSEGLLWLGWLFEREILTFGLTALLLFGLRGLARHLWAHRRKATETALFRIPLLGRLLRISILIRICQTLEAMMSGGLPLTESFALAAKNCGSAYYAEAVLLPTVERIRMGESLTDSLRDAPGLPPCFRGLIIAGEESGRLDHSFQYLKGLFEMELVASIETFLNALEPIAIASVGVIVLGVLLSVFAPLSKLIQAV